MIICNNQSLVQQATKQPKWLSNRSLNYQFIIIVCITRIHRLACGENPSVSLGYSLFLQKVSCLAAVNDPGHCLNRSKNESDMKWFSFRFSLFDYYIDLCSPTTILLMATDNMWFVLPKLLPKILETTQINVLNLA